MSHGHFGYSKYGQGNEAVAHMDDNRDKRGYQWVGIGYTANSKCIKRQNGDISHAVSQPPPPPGSARAKNKKWPIFGQNGDITPTYSGPRCKRTSEVAQFWAKWLHGGVGAQRAHSTQTRAWRNRGIMGQLAISLPIHTIPHTPHWTESWISASLLGTSISLFC